MSNTPSDEDIVALAISEGIKLRTGAGVVKLARAVLAKWGTPQPVVREPLSDDVVKDAARYRCIRRGQHWSVIDSIGNELRAEALDAAIDAALKQGANHD